MRIELGIMPYPDDSGYKTVLTLDGDEISITDENERQILLEVKDWRIVSEAIYRMIEARNAILEPMIAALKTQAGER